MNIKTQNFKTQLLFEAPITFSLLFAGVALFVSEYDPRIRSQLPNKKMQLRHWAKVWRLTRVTMPYSAITSIFAAVGAYYSTKQVLWLYGAAIFSIGLPYTLVAIVPFSKQLEAVLLQTPQTQLPQALQQPILNRISTWVRRHRIRGLLALASAAVFFLAKLYSEVEK